MFSVFQTSSIFRVGLASAGLLFSVAVPASASDFYLPEAHPDVIVLNAEIGDHTQSDLDAALAERPSATILALNSPGGSVEAAVTMAWEIRRRGLTTYVPSEMGCYSACAYMFLAGTGRVLEGELGVHQITSELADLVVAQNTLGDVIGAMQAFDVHAQVISYMLRTPPEDMHVFTATEISDYGIEAGEPISIALADDVPALAAGAYVQLSSYGDATQAEQSRAYVRERWQGVLGGSEPEVAETDGRFSIRVPAPTTAQAEELCTAIKAGGGGCYVTAN